MQVKINKDIREFNEAVFWGLTLRQVICSIIACVISVITFLTLKPRIGTEMASWICILVAIPAAAVGFVKYNGMSAEKFVMSFIKSEILLPKRLAFKSENTYKYLMDSMDKTEKRERKIAKFNIIKKKRHAK